MMSRVVVAATLVFAIASQTQANAAPIRTGHEEAAGARACTADGLIHAEVSPTIAQQVTNSIRVLAHVAWHGSVVEEEYPVADLGGRVESIIILPPPDAAGGTIALILSGRRGTYRAYLDTPKG